jgi:hypothetical protein
MDNSSAITARRQIAALRQRVKTLIDRLQMGIVMSANEPEVV